MMTIGRAACTNSIGWRPDSRSLSVEQLPRLRRSGGVGHLNVVPGLDAAQVIPQPLLCQQQTVPHAQLGTLLPGEESAQTADVNDRILRRTLRLAVEEVRNGRDGIELEPLVGVELKFHGSSALV